MSLYFLSKEDPAKPSTLKAQSISAFKEIFDNENSKIYTNKSFKKIECTRNRTKKRSKSYDNHILSDSSYIEISLNKNNKTRNSFNPDISINSFSIMNINEPKLFEIELQKNNINNKLNKKLARNDKMEVKFNSQNKQNNAKSKLKMYIRSNRNIKSPCSFTQRQFSKSAISTHFMESSSKKKLENNDTELKICSQLQQTIEKDIKVNKGMFFLFLNRTCTIVVNLLKSTYLKKCKIHTKDHVLHKTEFLGLK